MSVSKLSDCSKVILQNNPFTQISNLIIFNIKDNDAFRVYSYLQAKSSNWKVIKEDVKKQCGIGYRKLDQIFSYLKRSNLIQYVRVTDEKGKVIRIDIHVLNGLDFLIDEPFKPLKIKKKVIHKPTPALSAPAENDTCGNAQLLNKDHTKERKTKIKREPARKMRVPLSDDFVPDGERQKLAEETAKRVGLPIKELLAKFKRVAKSYDKRSADWQVEFESFLHNERPMKPDITANPSKVELKSTVMEYGPGHPTWEANQEWEKKHGKRSHGSEISRNHIR